MRGNTLHNYTAEKVRNIFLSCFYFVWLEFCFRANGVTTYFDVFGLSDKAFLAVEVETSCRHICDNFRKAQSVGVPVWFVVPNQKLLEPARRKLERENKGENNDFKILLLAQLQKELRIYLSRRIDKRINNKKTKYAGNYES